MRPPAVFARAGALLGVFACMLLGACGSTSHKLGSTGQLRLGFDSQAISVGDVATRLAIGAYAARTHRQLVTHALGSPENVVTALVRGELDVGSLRLPDLIKAVAAGAPVRGIAILQRQREFVLVALPSIRTVRALSGRAIAENGPGTDSETLARVALRRDGVTGARLVSIPNGPTRAAALLHGTVQAAGIRFSDYLRIHSRNPGMHILTSMPALLPGSIAQTLVVSNAFAAANPAALRAMVADTMGEFAVLYSPRGQAIFVRDARRDVLASDPVASARATYGYYRRIRIWPTAHDRLTPSELAAQERVYIRTGQLAASRPFTQVWNPSFG